MKPEEVSIFPVGGKNDAFAKYFVGQSYLNMLTTDGVVIGNVTFEPSCRNNWHIHHAKSGGGQILLCTAGHGYYQEWGKDAQELHPGDVVVIPAGVKHWHGAAAAWRLRRKNRRKKGAVICRLWKKQSQNNAAVVAMRSVRIRRAKKQPDQPTVKVSELRPPHFERAYQ